MYAPLSRRTLFHAGLAGGALAALGRGLRAAPAAHGGTNCRFPEDLAPPSDPLIEARARARAAGKPLLALAAHEPDPQQRGYLWGRFFANAPDEALAPLALCRVECLPASVVLARFDGCRAADVAWLFFDGPLVAPLAVSGVALGVPGDDALELGRRLRAALLPDAAAAQRLQRVDPVDLDLARETIAADLRPNLTLVERGACGFAEELARGALDAKTLAALAAVAARDAWHDAPEGGAWAHQSSYCPPCGRAYVDATARHFLSMWVEE